jgi:hypothetical protein
MSDEQKHLDGVENAVELKSLESLIVQKFDEIQAAYDQANGELKSIGEVNTETAGKIENLSKSYDELCDRVQDIEQKGVKIAEANTEHFDIGAEFAKSEGVENVINGRQGSARMEFKTAIINATGQNQPLVPSDRLGGIYTTPNRVLTIRDVLPSSTTDSNLVEYTRENSFTNNAGPQISGSPEAYFSCALAA